MRIDSERLKASFKQKMEDHRFHSEEMGEPFDGGVFETCKEALTKIAELEHEQVSCDHCFIPACKDHGFDIDKCSAFCGVELYGRCKKCGEKTWE